VSVEVNLGGRIKVARKAAGLTQEAVSKRTDLSLQAVGDIERGVVKDPHISSLRQIAEALGITLEELVREDRPAVPLGEPRSGHDEAVIAEAREEIAKALGLTPEQLDVVDPTLYRLLAWVSEDKPGLEPR
jgi:transcriptional regulator with XRE-family HTH domain